jgi:hypothetical protein
VLLGGLRHAFSKSGLSLSDRLWVLLLLRGHSPHLKRVASKQTNKHTNTGSG